MGPMQMETIKRISIGAEPLDRLLNGGLETDAITTVFGPAGSGKTNICIASAIAGARLNKKVIYIDAEGGFSTERFLQMANDSDEIASRIQFLRPMSWDSQSKIFNRLDSILNESFGLIIVDSITWLYRLELGKSGNRAARTDVNSEFSRQLAALTRIARLRKIPVLLSTQVYSDFDNRDNTKMVAGDLLSYSSKCIIELKKTPDGFRRAVLRKHRSLRDNLEVIFEIAGNGLQSLQSRSRRLTSTIVEPVVNIDDNT